MRIAFIALGILVAPLLINAARAQTLEEALILGYLSNPTLLSERASLRATDEDAVQASAGWRPGLSLDVSYGYEETRNEPRNGEVVKEDRQPFGGELQLSQNIFEGGRTLNNVLQAEQRSAAGRARLDEVEQRVFLQIINAYFNVVTARDVVALGNRRVRLLERQLRAAKDRFDVGEITRTDVAQAQARLARSRSNLSQSEYELVAAEAEYTRVVGQSPEDLERSTALPDLPATQEEALMLALEHSPELREAKSDAKAAGYAVSAAKGAFLPSIDVSGSYRYNRPDFENTNRQDVISVGARVSVPLYQRGAVSSRVRAVLARESAARMDVVASDRKLRADVRDAWEGLRSVRARVKADKTQVTANGIAFNGIEREAQAGLRTVLDVLDAEQELFDSRVSLTRSRRDEFVAAYRLLQVLGRMRAEDLGLQGVDFYDAEWHYQETQSRWFGYGAGNE
ncbi:MAG: TolC family outer membrane protein [Hyphomicrobiales bacterium]|nr:TolC family outer membrane protein [Hyphomicrobiales bacterium]